MAVAEGRAARGSRPAGRPSVSPSGGSSSASAAAIPSGMSSVRQGATRPSRSTIRSTTCLAIRRQVVSLPPVIVEHPRGGLVQLGLARDVDRLARVAGRDQRPHAGVGAGEVGAAELGAEEGVRRLEEVVDVVAAGLDVGDVALVVVVGGADQRPPVPGQGEDRAVLARRDDAGGARRPAGSSIETVTWVPRLGAILGTSASSWISSGRIRSAQTPVALITLSASTSNSSPDLGLDAAHPGGAPVVVEQARDLGAVQTDRAVALGLAEDREHEPHVVGLAVVEEVGLAAGRAAASAGISSATSSPEIVRWRFGRPVVVAGDPLGALAARHADPRRRHHVVHVEPDADRAAAPVVAERRDEERRRVDEVRGELDHELALEQRLADQPEVEVLQVAQARRGPSSTSGSRCRPRSRRARPGRPSSRARRRRARRPAPVIPPPMTTTSKRSPVTALSASARESIVSSR